MALLTTTIKALFIMPRDKDLHDKFVLNHDMTEWEKRDIGQQVITYVRESVMDLKEIDKF